MQLIKELQRRNVVRVAIGYIVSTWLLVQVADLVLENIGAPEWVMQTIMLVLALGFPVVLFFSWAYEVTPEGIKRESEIDRTQSITHVTGRKLDRAIVAVLVIALAYFAYDKFILDPSRDEALVKATTQAVSEQVPVELEGAEEAKKSIAVLPFVNMSSDEEQEYFSDGLSEELLNLLAKIPEMRVIARTSSFTYKGTNKQIADVARELNVNHVLEGSVRKAGNQVRITAQLIRASDSSHLWSDTFDRTLDDVFAIQDDIAASVVDALKISLLGEVPKVREVDPEAYALFLKGRFFKDRLDQESLQTAVNTLQEALEIDHDYALALVELADVYSRMSGAGFMNSDEFRALAGDAITRALSVDDRLAEAHALLGAIKFQYDWDWKGARSALQRALELAPMSSTALYQSAVLSRAFGRFDEAIEWYRISIAQDPLQPITQLSLGTALSWAGRLEEALVAYEEALLLSPQAPQVYMGISTVLLQMGRAEEALEKIAMEPEPAWRQYGKALALIELDRQQEASDVLAEYIETFQDDWAYQIAVVYAYKGDTDEAFSWLDRAFDQRDAGAGQSREDPFLIALHNDPRWPLFLEKVGISDAQVAAIFNDYNDGP